MYGNTLEKRILWKEMQLVMMLKFCPYSTLNPPTFITHGICLFSILNAGTLIIGIRLVTYNLKQSLLLILFRKD